jgi:hypothetical protein
MSNTVHSDHQIQGDQPLQAARGSNVRYYVTINQEEDSEGDGHCRLDRRRTPDGSADAYIPNSQRLSRR